MDAMIKNGDQLVQWFLERAPFPCAEDDWQRGLRVTTKVRCEILTSGRQGMLILKGRLRTIQFENLGGGVYRAYLDVAKPKGGTDGT